MLTVNIWLLMLLWLSWKNKIIIVYKCLCMSSTHTTDTLYFVFSASDGPHYMSRLAINVTEDGDSDWVHTCKYSHSQCQFNINTFCCVQSYQTEAMQTLLVHCIKVGS